jgi:hypothetical protein
LAYLGRTPLLASYNVIDDISSSFDGGTVSFALTTGAAPIIAGSERQLVVSVGGVLQEPGASYTLDNSTPSQSNVVFTTAPDFGMSFWGTLLGETLDIGTVSDGSITPVKVANTYELVKKWQIAINAMTAAAGDRLIVDNGITINLPAITTNGDYIELVDKDGNWDGSSSINGAGAPYIDQQPITEVSLNTPGAHITLISDTASSTWRIR